jgi:alpha-1,2-glucosyltransferase
MLYIWPYMVFFSFPILLPFTLRRVFGLTGRPPVFWVRIADALPRIWVVVITCVTAAIVVKYNTIIHPFTLADNRHYVFYVFKYLRYSWLFKYFAIPVYLVSGTLTIAPLHEMNVGFSIVWLATSTLSLVTAPLVEPRYFIIPWVIWRLHSNKALNSVAGTAGAAHASIWLWTETVWYVLINIITGYIFLDWTFEWPQEAGVKQRFMW